MQTSYLAVERFGGRARPIHRRLIIAFGRWRRLTVAIAVATIIARAFVSSIVVGIGVAHIKTKGCTSGTKRNVETWTARAQTSLPMQASQYRWQSCRSQTRHHHKAGRQTDRLAFDRVLNLLELESAFCLDALKHAVGNLVLNRRPHRLPGLWYQWSQAGTRRRKGVGDDATSIPTSAAQFSTSTRAPHLCSRTGQRGGREATGGTPSRRRARGPVATRSRGPRWTPTTDQAPVGG